MTPQDTPEYRAIEQAAEKKIPLIGVPELRHPLYVKDVLAQRSQLVEFATSPEAERFWKRWIPVTQLPEQHIKRVLLYDPETAPSQEYLAYRIVDASILKHCADKCHWQELPPAP